jgi:hypothetical protein
MARLGEMLRTSISGRARARMSTLAKPAKEAGECLSECVFLRTATHASYQSWQVFGVKGSSVVSMRSLHDNWRAQLRIVQDGTSTSKHAISLLTGPATPALDISALDIRNDRVVQVHGYKSFNDLLTKRSEIAEFDTCCAEHVAPQHASG